MQMLLYCLLNLCHNRILTALSRLYRNVPFAQRSDDLHETFDDCIEVDDPSSDPMLWANTLTASYINAGSACGTTQNDRLIALFEFMNGIDYWKYHKGQKIWFMLFRYNTTIRRPGLLYFKYKIAFSL